MLGEDLPWRKMRGGVPRVVRSPLVEKGRGLFIAGSEFEDGLDRVWLDDSVSDEKVADLTALLEQRDRDRERLEQTVLVLQGMLAAVSRSTAIAREATLGYERLAQEGER